MNNFTFHYAFYVVMNWLPTYFDSVLHAGLASAGSAKMLPYLVMFAMSNVGGYAGDWLIGRRYSVARARKMVNTAGVHCCQPTARSTLTTYLTQEVVSSQGNPRAGCRADFSLLCWSKCGWFDLSNFDIDSYFP